MPFLLFGSFLSLLLFSSCTDFMTSLSNTPQAFTVTHGEFASPYWKPNESLPLPLTIASDSSSLADERFRILAATINEDEDVLDQLDATSLTLGTSTLYYIPSRPGDHTLRLRIGLPREPDGAQEVVCPITVPAAPWKIRGRVDETGRLSFHISGIGDAWADAQWRLQSVPIWSEGIVGTLQAMQGEQLWDVDVPTPIDCNGTTRPALHVALTTSTLADPTLRLSVVGPDEIEKDVSIDLLPLCSAQLKRKLGPLEQELTTHLTEVREACESMATYCSLDDTLIQDPTRRRKREEEIVTQIATLLGQGETYTNLLTRLRDQDPDNLHLPAFRLGKQHLEAMLRRLKSTQIQLQKRCTTPHDALAKALSEEGQETNITTLIHDPTLNVNARIPIEVERQDEQVCTLLGAAVYYGNTEAVRMLLARESTRIPPEAEVDNMLDYPLHIASGKGNTEIMKLLLDHGYEINAQSIGNWLPIHKAVCKGHTEAVSLLLDRGANVNAPCGTSITGDTENTSLHLAVRHNHSAIVELLLSSPNINVNTQNQSFTTHLEQAYHAIKESSKHKGDIELERAIALRELMTLGLDINPRRVMGISASGSDLQVIDEIVLLEGYPFSSCINGAQSALHIACSEGNTEIVNALLEEENINTDILNDQGASPLYYAIASGDIDSVRILLQRNVEVNRITNGIRYDGYREPYLWGMQSTAHNGRLTSPSGWTCPVNGDHGISPLHLAAFKGDTDIVEELLNNGADINQLVEGRKFNALHLASFKGNEDVIRLLIDKGIDLGAETRNGHTALTLALPHGSLQTLGYLYESFTSKAISIPKKSMANVFKGITRDDEEGKKISKWMKERNIMRSSSETPCTIS